MTNLCSDVLGILFHFSLYTEVDNLVIGQNKLSTLIQ